jgi:hypothetical protein
MYTNVCCCRKIIHICGPTGNKDVLVILTKPNFTSKNRINLMFKHAINSDES